MGVGNVMWDEMERLATRIRELQDRLQDAVGMKDFCELEACIAEYKNIVANMEFHAQ